MSTPVLRRAVGSRDGSPGLDDDPSGRARVPFDWGVPSVFTRQASPSLLVAVVAVAGAVVVGAGASLGLITALGALLAVCGGLAVLARPAVGGLALVCLVPLLSGVARGLPVPGVKVSELIVLGAAGLILATSPRRGGVRIDALDLMVFAYVIATAGLGLYNLSNRGEPVTTEAATVLFAPVQFLLIFRAVRISLSTPDLRRTALRWFLYLSAVPSLVGLAQQVAGSAVNPLLQQLTASASTLNGNSTGLFASKHDFAGYLLVVILLSTALLLTPAQRVMPLWPLRVVLLLAFFGMSTTIAFAAMGGTVLGVVLMSRRRRRLLRVMGAFSIVVVAVGVFFGPTIVELSERQFTSPPVVTSTTSAPTWLPQSVAYRTAVWQDQYIPALTPHLVAGYGPTLPPSVAWQYTESAYLTFLLRGGLALLLLFAAVNIVIYIRAGAAERSSDPTQWALGLTVRALVVVLFFINATNPYIFNAGLSHPFWMLVALLAASPPAPAAFDQSPRIRRG